MREKKDGYIQENKVGQCHKGEKSQNSGLEIDGGEPGDSLYFFWPDA